MQAQILSVNEVRYSQHTLWKYFYQLHLVRLQSLIEHPEIQPFVQGQRISLGLTRSFFFQTIQENLF